MSTTIASPISAWVDRLEAAEAIYRYGVAIDSFDNDAIRAAFGGYKQSGIGRENHKAMLDHYTQTKCLLVSYDPEPLGLF